MWKYDAAFIGAGNMGGALLRAICKGKTPYSTVAYDANGQTLESIAAETGCAAAGSADEAVRSARFVFVCVKPQGLAAVLSDLAPALRAGQTVVSIAAGVPLARLRECVGAGVSTVRVMPNTPAAVGQGVLLVTPDETVPSAEYEALAALLSPCGLVERVTERELDLATAITGCGPAFAYLFLEAIADGGVEIGLSREQAQRYAAQMLLGAAQMVLQTGAHPGALKDAVCSPGGSTIAGVAALERAGFRAAAARAVSAAHEKNKTLGG